MYKTNDSLYLESTMGVKQNKFIIIMKRKKKTKTKKKWF